MSRKPGKDSRSFAREMLRALHPIVIAAARIGVGDYRNLVTDKLSTARDLYESMVNEFHQQRAFFLVETGHRLFQKRLELFPCAVAHSFP